MTFANIPDTPQTLKLTLKIMMDFGDLLFISLEHNGYHWTSHPFLSFRSSLPSFRLITARALRERARHRTVTTTRDAWLSNACYPVTVVDIALCAGVGEHHAGTLLYGERGY